jgi:hypothetical protein
MELKTHSGQTIDPNRIDYILWGIRVSGIPGTLVQLKTGEEVFLDNPEEEVIRAMNLAAEPSAVDNMETEEIWTLGLH